MTPRERFLETLLFRSPDKIPFNPGGYGPRESTLRAWHSQGMPRDRNHMDLIQQLVDARRAERGLSPGDFNPKMPLADLGVSFRLMPEFEEQILAHRDGHLIVQDGTGAIVEFSDQYDFSYIRGARDFVTRKWHRFPVSNWDEWAQMEWRFDPNMAGRFPADFDERCARLKERDYPFILHFNGPFWQLREFAGMEGLCMLMCDQPDLVHAMANRWREFCMDMVQRILERVTPDMLLFSEDMAYKEKPMISPEMTREFCGPFYRALIEECRAAGTELFAVDSDGRVDLLIPVWIECGINCLEPMEVAAGNDVNALRAAFGVKMAFRGGIDKRAMAAGGERLKTELARVAPVIRSGGYIPGCDHAMPPDISWLNYQDCALQVAELTGWL